MSTFIERLEVERKELNERTEKLGAFIDSEAFKKIEPIQMSLLNIQLQAMQTYSQCLLERLMWLVSSNKENN